jgi:hypothetical protein
MTIRRKVCLPTSAPQPSSGEAWLHEIKHGGFRVARKDGERMEAERKQWPR